MEEEAGPITGRELIPDTTTFFETPNIVHDQQQDNLVSLIVRHLEYNY